MVVSQQNAGCTVHCVSTMRNGWLFAISEHPQLFVLLRMKCTDDDKRVGCPFVILDFIKVHFDFQNTLCILTEFGSHATRNMFL